MIGGKTRLLLLLLAAAMASSSSITSFVPLTGQNGERTIKIHLIRHAHGTHNAVGELNYEAYKLEEHEDALLSDEGLTQCKTFSTSMQAKLRKADAVLISPMRRTLQTAQHSLPLLIEQGTPFIALESLREQTGLHPCDRRRDRSFLAASFQHVDFALVASEQDPLYFNYVDEREPSSEVFKRCREFVSWLSSKRELEEVVVVTHSAYLRHFLPLCHGEEEVPHTDHFENCEMRSFLMTLK